MRLPMVPRLASRVAETVTDGNFRIRVEGSPMKRWEAWSSHVATIVVTASGLAYLWMKYAMENDDPFAVVNHPWQSAMLGLHVLAAPFLVFVIGLVANNHILKKLRGGVSTNRRSGIVSIVSLPMMIVSGYMLQVVTTAWLIQVALIAHLASSSVFVLTYGTHLVVSWRLSARKAAEVRQSQSLAARELA